MTHAGKLASSPFGSNSNSERELVAPLRNWSADSSPQRVEVASDELNRTIVFRSFDEPQVDRLSGIDHCQLTIIHPNDVDATLCDSRVESEAGEEMGVERIGIVRENSDLFVAIRC